MAEVMLDIGAGSTKFARLFRRFNPGRQLTYLCGEPDWRGRWSGNKHPNSIQKIGASYDKFNVPEASLGLVTLNAFHPLMRPGGIESELVRALIPGNGIFISAHPVGYHPDLKEEFFHPIVFYDLPRGKNPRKRSMFTKKMGFWGTPVSSMVIGPKQLIHYPASSTIRSRLREIRLPHELRNRSSTYCYSQSNAHPTIMVWLRNDRAAP